jgi:hypothetical protein
MLIMDIQTQARWPLVRGGETGSGGVIQIVVDPDGRQNQGRQRRLPDNWRAHIYIPRNPCSW